MQTQLQQAQNNLAYINKDTMNEFCTNISDIFTQSRAKTFQSTSYHSENINDKRWFGPRCRLARRKYYLARRINQQNPSTTNRLNLKKASKSYKRTMNFYLNKFNKETQDELRSLKSKSPKAFWKIMNSSERKNEGNDIDLETLFNFFKNLNENTGTQDDEENLINIDTSDDDEILNSSITEAEILKCLKLLKNNKCSASDSILNEYLKHSSGKMLPIYILFFNLISETGISLEP